MIAYPRYTTVKSFLEEVPKNDYSFLGFTLLILLVYSFFGLRPGLIEAARTFADVRAAKQADSFLTHKIEKLAEYYARREVFFEKQALLELSLPSEPAQAQIILDLAVFTGRSGIDIRSFSFQPPDTNQEGLKGIPLALGGEGNFSEIVSFIEEFEKAKRQYTIEQVNLTSSETTGVNDLHLRLTAFYIE